MYKPYGGLHSDRSPKDSAKPSAVRDAVNHVEDDRMHSDECDDDDDDEDCDDDSDQDGD